MQSEGYKTGGSKLSTNGSPAETQAPLALHNLSDGWNGYVGIFRGESRNDGVYFVRDLKMQSDFPFWADISEIAPKNQTKKRVLLLGESVARGYFFEPEYSCARILQSCLSVNERSVEVVDLAKSGVSFSELNQICLDAFKMQPDLMVIFGGNNLTIHDDILLSEDYDRLSTVLEQNPESLYADLKSIVEERFAKIVTRFLETVSAEALGAGIPVIYVIPEFNLLDWKAITHYDRCVVWPQTSTRKINELITEGENCKRNSNLSRLYEIGNELVRLASSLSVGHEFLAEYWLSMGEAVKARQSLINGKDCGILRIGLLARIFSVTRSTILAWASQSKAVEIVDLCDIFEHHSPNGIPGKSFFMDYCHLTAEGLIIAMNKVAEKVALLLDDSLPFYETDLEINGEVVAKAHFCAALHCAHYGPQIDLVQHHCREAIKHNSAAAAWMLLYLDLVSKRIPWNMNPSYYKLLRLKVLRNYEGGIHFFQLYTILDIELADAMLAAIEPLHPGTSRRIIALRNYHFSIDSLGEVDLLDSAYSKNSYITHKSRNFHWQSVEVKSRFLLLVGNPSDIKLTLTYRTPHQVDINSIIVTLNDQSVAVLAASAKWFTATFTISSDCFLANINTLQITWPDIGRERKRGDGESTEAFVKRSYQPLFGEIMTFTAELNRESGQRISLLAQQETNIS